MQSDPPPEAPPAEAPPRDRVKELHSKVDEVAYALSASLDTVPDEPRTTEPHPSVASIARDILARRREFDDLCDALARDWTLTTTEQKERLRVLRIAHAAAGRDVLAAEGEYKQVLDSVTEVLDNMYEAQKHIIPRTAVLSNRAIRPAVEILRANLSARATAFDWPPPTPGRQRTPHPRQLAPLPDPASDDGLRPQF
mmetsp:Transcript_15657/g.51241  ORF Transcript_15657/g.51241 Transcript_15657/m.51241 type:complete len:197 (+) Transcript_15657:3912-4502(+)